MRTGATTSWPDGHRANMKRCRVGEHCATLRLRSCWRERFKHAALPTSDTLRFRAWRLLRPLGNENIARRNVKVCAPPPVRRGPPGARFGHETAARTRAQRGAPASSPRFSVLDRSRGGSPRSSLATTAAHHMPISSTFRRRRSRDARAALQGFLRGDGHGLRSVGAT